MGQFHNTPFLRWAGGKQWLVDKIEEIHKNRFDGYYEPFLGGGSLFLYSSPQKAILGDTNRDLINTYQIVRDFPDELVRSLKELKNNEETYYSIRNHEFSTDLEKATKFIYLNKTCWNGLYRVNKNGFFNVPFGNNKRAIFNSEEIYRASDALKGAKLICADFEETLQSAKKGDFIYLDPPYTVLHSQNGFRQYNEKLFSWNDQIRLANISNKLVEKGCQVIVSNAPVQEVVDLYVNFHIEKFYRHSILAANSRFRRKIEEVLLISNSIQ